MVYDFLTTWLFSFRDKTITTVKTKIFLSFIINIIFHKLRNIKYTEKLVKYIIPNIASILSHKEGL